jgi:hypothetical protein
MHRSASRSSGTRPTTNELGTRNRINEYLRFDAERIHPVTREPGSARLFFVKVNAPTRMACNTSSARLARNAA